MKKKTLLPIALLAVGLAMAACGTKTDTSSKGGASDAPTSSEVAPTPSSSEEDVSQYNISISNKDELQASGWVAGASRTINLAITPAGNVTALINSGDIKITSSNTEVVSISGKVATAGKTAGKATITVTYKTHTDTVEVTNEGEMKEPAHQKKTVAELVNEVSDKNVKTVIYEVEAYVVAWQSGKDNGTKYGNYYIADSMDKDAKQILVYGSSANATLTWGTTSYTVTSPEDFLTDSSTKDIGIGYKLKLEVCGLMYNTTQELTGKVVSAEAPAAVKAETVTLNADKGWVRVGKTYTAKATLGPVGGVGTLTWTSSDEKVATVADGVITGVKAGTATITASLDGTEAKATVAITVEEEDTSATLITAPVVGTAYKAGIAHAGIYAASGKYMYYVDGTLSANSYYLNTITDASSAVDVYLENVGESTDKYYMYFKSGEAKKYIELYCSDAENKYYNPRIVDTPTYAATYDSKLNTLVFDIDGVSKVISTSGTSTYNTIGSRNASESDYAMHFYTVAATEPVEPEKYHGQTVDDALTPSEAVAIAKTAGTTATTNKYYITGKISSIETAFSSASGFVTVYISNDGTTEGDQFEVYKLYGIDGKKFLTTYDVEVGDTITVNSTIKTFEVKDYSSGDGVVTGYVYETADKSVSLVSIAKSSDVKHLVLDKTTAIIDAGKSVAVTAYVGPTTGTNALGADVKWSVTGEGATLDVTSGANVNVSCATVGTVVVTATYGEGDNAIVATCTITVDAVIETKTVTSTAPTDTANPYIKEETTTNYADKIGLDTSVFDVQFKKNTCTNGSGFVRLNAKDKVIQVYSKASIVISVKAAEGKTAVIKDVTVNLSANGTMTIDGTEFVANKGSVRPVGTSVEIVASSTSQIKVSSISITYGFTEAE